VVVSQNVPVYTSPDSSANPIIVANNTTFISETPSTSDQSSGSSDQATTQNKSQNVNYTGNTAAAINSPAFNMFGGILTIDPAVVRQFKLQYLRGKQ